MLRLLPLLLVVAALRPGIAQEALQDDVLAAARAANAAYQRHISDLARSLPGEDVDRRVTCLMQLGRTRDLTVLRHILPWMDADVHDARTVQAACYAVVNLGAIDATDTLRKVAAEEDLQDPAANAVRITALNALHQLNQLAAVDYRREADTANETTRAVGVTDLGTIGDKEAGKILAAALQNDSNHIRRMAAIGLGRLGNSEYGETLADALADPDALVRRYAAEGLVLLGYKRGIPKLLMAMDANLAGGDLRRAIQVLAGDDFGYDPQGNLIDRQDAVSRGFVWWNENEKNFR